jgi:hypothetical protein
MNETEQISYTCQNCGYTNVWTHNEILQRGEEIIYRGDDDTEEIFSLPCKNPRLKCPQRTKVAVRNSR